MKTDRLISLCQRHQALLLNSDEQTIAIAVVDAPTPELMEALRFATQKRIDIECWSQAQMDKRQQTATHPSPPAHSDTAADVIGQVQQILEQALRQRASDIHFEPEENHLRIRLRVDGVLHALSPLPPNAQPRSPRGLKCSATWTSPSIACRRMASLPCPLPVARSLSV